MKNRLILFVLLIFSLFFGCQNEHDSKPPSMTKKEQKKVIYQVFTRLFGNDNTTNKPWGTIEENGVGKFNDFTDEALAEIRDLGVSHIWYTGILHHAMVTDYTQYGISNDDPDVVKGRAGSPYAVKDYYSVDPDMASDPAKRMEEFLALVERTHAQNMKVIIDIVPNHIARKYEGMNNPEGVVDFGANDDTSVEYKKDNNFYYVIGESFKVPHWQHGYKPLGGETHPLVNGEFKENPAKWTGNGSRLSQPDQNDWYETVKINYGVRPDGTKDFDSLPQDFRSKDHQVHFDFWKDKSVPDSWIKFRDIALFWLEKGVDGLRYDMAEMVPVEFWSYLNSSIKVQYPDALLLAEVYNPGLYRDYIQLGKMDYLYDKVGFYDSIKHIVQGHGWTDHIPKVQEEIMDIEHHMLHFLENHDEQRIASPDFAGSAEKGKPAMVVSTTISTSPTLVYFAQELGEPGAENAGFGSPTRTSIFDYIGVPHLQRWTNDKKFDGGSLSAEEKELRNYYEKLLNFSLHSSALMGDYREIHYFNKDRNPDYDHRIFSFVRWSEDEIAIVVSNFDVDNKYVLDLIIPKDLIDLWKLKEGDHKLIDQLDESSHGSLKVSDKEGVIGIKLAPLASHIFVLKKNE
ncbi:alpha-amylase family protein [Lutimonas sp.]|uniref:alpha-amylase family protein n=1 Tax=Lutimonas sp. TaxID=1872403 RepID=UPI003D9B0348